VGGSEKGRVKGRGPAFVSKGKAIWEVKTILYGKEEKHKEKKPPKQTGKVRPRAKTREKSGTARKGARSGTGFAGSPKKKGGSRGV